MGKEQYEVEKILKCRVFKGRQQYYLKWKGYATAEATWEDATNLDCDDLLAEFLKTENKGKAKETAKKRQTPIKKKAPPKKTHKPQSDSEGGDNDEPYKVPDDLFRSAKDEVDSSDQDVSYEPSAKKTKRTGGRSEVSTPIVSEKPGSSRSAHRTQRQQKKSKEFGSSKDSGGHASIQNSDGYESPVDEPKQKTKQRKHTLIKSDDEEVSQTLQKIRGEVDSSDDDVPKPKAKQRHPNQIESDDDEENFNSLQENVQHSSGYVPMEVSQPLQEVIQNASSGVVPMDVGNAVDPGQVEASDDFIHPNPTVEVQTECGAVVKEEPLDEETPRVKEEILEEEPQAAAVAQNLAVEQFEDIDDDTVMSMLDFTNCKVVAHEVINGSNYYKMQFHQGAVELLVVEETVIEKAPGEMLSYFIGKNSIQELGSAAAAPPSVQ